MSSFYERQMRRMFGDSEVLSADTIFAGKAMVSKISDDQIGRASCRERVSGSV